MLLGYVHKWNSIKDIQMKKNWAFYALKRTFSATLRWAWKDVARSPSNHSSHHHFRKYDETNKNNTAHIWALFIASQNECRPEWACGMNKKKRRVFLFTKTAKLSLLCKVDIRCTTNNSKNVPNKSSSCGLVCFLWCNFRYFFIHKPPILNAMMPC